MAKYKLKKDVEYRYGHNTVINHTNITDSIAENMLAKGRLSLSDFEDLAEEKEEIKTTKKNKK